ncbi:MAG: cbb3-type cytochrome c oxidase subunit 3 [Burkholderiaceae bacterium]
MSTTWGWVAGLITIVLMVVFLGIWFWAWRARHKRVFDRMAQLPMQDSDAPHSDEEEEQR